MTTEFKVMLIKFDLTGDSPIPSLDLIEQIKEFGIKDITKFSSTCPNTDKLIYKICIELCNETNRLYRFKTEIGRENFITWINKNDKK